MKKPHRWNHRTSHSSASSKHNKNEGSVQVQVIHFLTQCALSSLSARCSSSIRVCSSEWCRYHRGKARINTFCFFYLAPHCRRIWFQAYNKLCSTELNYAGATSPPDCRSSTRILRSMWTLALLMEFISRYPWTLWTFTQLKENTSLSMTESEDSSPEDTANRSTYMD